MGLISKCLSSWVLAGSLPRVMQIKMYTETNTRRGRVQSNPISEHKHKETPRCVHYSVLYLRFLLSLITFSHTTLTFSPFHVRCICARGARLCAFVRTAGASMMVDRMITGLSVLLVPQRKHICSKSRSPHKHTLPASL